MTKWISSLGYKKGSTNNNHCDTPHVNRTKDEKDRVVSTDAEKACDQRVQHSFKIKMLNSLEMDDLREHKKGRI